VDINGTTERLNIITQVSRIQGDFIQEGGTFPFDRVQITFDITTYQGNTDPRFEMSAVKAFYPRALEIRDKILTMLKEGMDG